MEKNLLCTILGANLLGQWAKKVIFLSLSDRILRESTYGEIFDHENTPSPLHYVSSKILIFEKF